MVDARGGRGWSSGGMTYMGAAPPSAGKLHYPSATRQSREMLIQRTPKIRRLNSNSPPPLAIPDSAWKSVHRERGDILSDMPNFSVVHAYLE